jgi:hypothetical protein
MPITITFGRRILPDRRDEVLDIVDAFPPSMLEQVEIIDNPNGNYVIRVDTCSGVYFGNGAIEFIGNVAKVTRLQRDATRYAQGGVRDIDIHRAISKQADIARDAWVRTYRAPAMDIDHYGATYDPQDWVPPTRTYLTVPITEAGGQHDPSSCFVPRRIDPYVFPQTYLDSRARYGTRWQ